SVWSKLTPLHGNRPRRPRDSHPSRKNGWRDGGPGSRQRRAENCPVPRNSVFLQLDQGAPEIAGGNKSDPFPRHIIMRVAVAKDAHARLAQFAKYLIHRFDAKRDMMDAALRIALQKLRNRGIGSRWFHQLDPGVAEVDIGEPHPLLRVN